MRFFVSIEGGKAGPAQQDLEWGGGGGLKREPDFFFRGGGVLQRHATLGKLGFLLLSDIGRWI